MTVRSLFLLLIVFSSTMSLVVSEKTCSKLDDDYNCSEMSTTERTFIAIKPDGVQRGLVAKIIGRFEDRGYKLVALKMTQPSKEHLEVHYQDLKDKPFFGGLVTYMGSGPIVAMVWEGLDAVKTGRTILGTTNPLQSAPGTIRGDFCLQTGRNICHGSDSVESANREIKHWFSDNELHNYESAFKSWLYE
ncbi:Nucleoside diphosphate kinase [Aphelenchoides besseyi]|nr:Nucleoside diphosphate kinase [Aphelenchoides besseyi]KAI6209799.1 Nucleoside diphosphate kinase [Aphelenchoides besseyi]